jgi:mannose/cellobiose epimerase-like protein (N-acyl-D-glucosamine 2-epimerase family)
VLPRQIYAFAAAKDLGWTGPWREAVDHGLSYYLDIYRKPDGLFRALVGPGGVSLDDTSALYDQAFAMFVRAANEIVSDPDVQCPAWLVGQDIDPIACHGRRNHGLPGAAIVS